MDNTCGKCRWWDAYDCAFSTSAGRCRRLAAAFGWVGTKREDWCGMYEAAMFKREEVKDG